jgi:PAS domain-containing protein
MGAACKLPALWRFTPLVKRAAAIGPGGTRQQMEEIFDVLREPVIIFDAKGRPVRANTAVYRVFGLHGPPADAKGYLDLVRSLDIRTLDGCEVGLDALPSRRILRGEDRVQETYVLRHRAGHDLVMEVLVARLSKLR